MDLPLCNFKNCWFHIDGNCIKNDEYYKCEYIRLMKTLEEIISAQRLCSLCGNMQCKNSAIPLTKCDAAWNGISL